MLLLVPAHSNASLSPGIGDPPGFLPCCHGSGQHKKHPTRLSQGLWIFQDKGHLHFPKWQIFQPTLELKYYFDNSVFKTCCPSSGATPQWQKSTQVQHRRQVCRRPGVVIIYPKVCFSSSGCPEPSQIRNFPFGPPGSCKHPHSHQEHLFSQRDDGVHMNFFFYKPA